MERYEKQRWIPGGICSVCQKADGGINLYSDRGTGGYIESHSACLPTDMPNLAYPVALYFTRNLRNTLPSHHPLTGEKIIYPWGSRFTGISRSAHKYEPVEGNEHEVFATRAVGERLLKIIGIKEG